MAQAGPDLGMGKMASCPRASTKRSLYIFHEIKLTSIEYDILREIDFDKLTQDFARVKSRKVSGARFTKAGIPPRKSDASGGIGPKHIITLTSGFSARCRPLRPIFPVEFQLKTVRARIQHISSQI